MKKTEKYYSRRLLADNLAAAIVLSIIALILCTAFLGGLGFFIWLMLNSILFWGAIKNWKDEGSL